MFLSCLSDGQLKKVADKLLRKFSGVGCLTSNNNPFDIGVDRIQQFLTEFLPLRNRRNCENFAVSATLAKVCDLRVLLVLYAVD